MSFWRNFRQGARTAGDLSAALGVLTKLAGAFALVALGLFFLQLRDTGLEMQLLAAETRVAVADTRIELRSTMQNVNAILIQAGLAADQARLASTEQREYLKQLNQHMDRTFVQVHKVLVETELAVGQIRDTTQVIGGDVHAMSEATVTALESLPPLLEQANQTLQASEKVISDPNIPATLEQANKTMAAVTGTMQEVEKTAGHIEKKVQQLTKPASLLKRILGGVLDLGSKARILLFGQ